MTMDIIGIIGTATAAIGFITIWIKIGGRLGRHENTLETLKERMGKAEEDVASLKSETSGIQIEIARFMGAIGAKLDYIKETVDSLRGGRRAEEK